MMSGIIFYSAIVAVLLFFALPRWLWPAFFTYGRLGQGPVEWCDYVGKARIAKWLAYRRDHAKPPKGKS